MAGIKDVASVWSNIKEIDLKPIRDSATHPVRIAIVGEPGSGRHTLAEQMRTDPLRPGVHTQTTISFPTLEASLEPPAAHLTIIMVDARRSEFALEQSLANKWSEAGRNVLVFVNKIDLLENNTLINARDAWRAVRIIYGSAVDTAYLQRDFIPVMLEMLPEQHLALGRQFPLFRIPIAQQLINDTCFSNAAYSFGTGLAEIVPVLDIPLNITDIIVLTKSQAFLAYKLGLLVGYSTNWQQYVKEFGGVIGGGFIWRQIARSIVGLIPGWGILPKTAVAYSGTYVVGHAILGWYLNGKHLSPQEMRALTRQAFTRGKDYTRRLGERLPKRKLREAKVHPQLEADSKIDASSSVLHTAAGEGEMQLPPASYTEGEIGGKPTPSGNASKQEPAMGKKKLAGRKGQPTEQIATRICPNCGKISSADAGFCQYCGKPFVNE